MPEPKAFLRELIRTSGLSGYETAVRELIQTGWEPLCDEIHLSKIGSLHALKAGKGESPRPALLLAAHMDAIGMMVTRLVDGFLYLTEIGGIDARVLPGQPVIVHGRDAIPGIVVQPPPWLLPEDQKNGIIGLEHLVVDTGLTAARVAKIVQPGDLVSFASDPFDLGNDLLGGHSLDNRASVAALYACLSELGKRSHDWDVWAVATVQEEETLGGAATSAFALQPQLAIAIDVTYGTGPGTPTHQSFGLGDGPVLGWGPNIHPGVHRAVKEAAKRLEMDTQFEPLPGQSGTDAIALQVAAVGIPTMVISIPLRYMHTPVEVVHMKDIERTGRLLAEFIAGLDTDFMDNLSWDSDEG